MTSILAVTATCQTIQTTCQTVSADRPGVQNLAIDQDEPGDVRKTLGGSLGG
ncbi:hypothetical protein ZHAS_00017788 [Anopheles sinensis]|uniref:Uncharacterized protein n=1 Tax=Anopheles sinensis TaxID=74873 RepID=A0A084WHS9_ANOSI|nr:hypothetical protein ZHAS_00017788 [Anopheles sinensis]